MRARAHDVIRLLHESVQVYRVTEAAPPEVHEPVDSAINIPAQGAHDQAGP